MESVIAIVMDCDDTLCDDSTNFLLSRLGINEKKFWAKIATEIADGWDPTLVYMIRLIEMCRKRGITLTQDVLKNAGKRLSFYKGVPVVFDELREFVATLSKKYKTRLNIEFYVVSSGFEELIGASALTPKVSEIFGCTFAYDKAGNVLSPKSAVNFTEKTKFLFAINKGITKSELRSNPGSVNNSIDTKDRRIPLNRTIYIGDGPTDIPCFSVVTNSGGKGIGILKPSRPERGAPLWKGKRLTVGPYKPFYSKGSNLRIMLEQLIEDIAGDINESSKKRLYPS